MTENDEQPRLLSRLGWSFVSIVLGFAAGIVFVWLITKF